ncbi:SOS response-associated peptidase [Arthrobacter sp. SO3]|uniref:SOS response-associated peptidase n=1 Tax=Arthrobacter sp. SO3 TaxID=1897057 RepID=UPI001CFF63FC|nr:SOS response-associated peptidase [Arthrobacter sp. SO3]MCB5293392.1 hypothetical protein [Arthrobacter sp. SO3]
MNDTIDTEAVLVRVRGLLGEFMTPADADAAIVSFRECPESHTDEVQRVRREWNAKNARRARTIRVFWRTYWAGAVVLTAVVVGLAMASGNGENVTVAAILGAVGAVHDRSPVVIPKDRVAEWPDPDLTGKNDVQRPLDSVPDPTLTPRIVSTGVNSVGNNWPELTEPAE